MAAEARVVTERPQGDLEALPDPRADLSMMVRAAWLYYEDGLIQADVARKLHVSRQTVSRLLEAARQRGIVRIEFDTRYLAAHRVATRLAEQSGLEDVVVVPMGGTGRHARDRIAAAGAAYLRRYLRPGAVIGVGWGDTIARTLSLIPGELLTGVTLASIAGGITSITDALTANSMLAAHLRLLPAPVLVSTADLATQLNNEESVRSVLDLAARADLTLTSVGGADPATASSVRNALVTAAEAEAFRAMGGVGDMIGEWFDARGEVLHEATSARRIGLKLSTLREMPGVVCVAGGKEKISAIQGAIAGRVIKILITDEETAQALVKP